MNAPITAFESAMFPAQQFVRRLLAAVLYHLRQWSPFHSQPGTVAPQEGHLDPQRRLFLFPQHAGAVLFSWLQKDEIFLSLLPKDGLDQYVMRFAVCGTQLRLNLHRVEEATRDAYDSSLSLEPVYHDKADSLGVFSYLLDHDCRATRLTRRLPGLHYAPADVRFSYTRELTVDEIKEIDTLRLHDL